MEQNINIIAGSTHSFSPTGRSGDLATPKPPPLSKLVGHQISYEVWYEYRNNIRESNSYSTSLNRELLQAGLIYKLVFKAASPYS